MYLAESSSTQRKFHDIRVIYRTGVSGLATEGCCLTLRRFWYSDQKQILKKITLPDLAQKGPKSCFLKCTCMQLWLATGTFDAFLLNYGALWGTGTKGIESHTYCMMYTVYRV